MGVGKHFQALVGLGLLGVAVSACGGNGGPILADESEDPRSRSNGYCVRQSAEGPVMRVINRTDPELCGIKTRERPKEYVRVIAPK